ncbi:MAG: hypothetical protein LH624_01635 [Cryobacterium sp.]|nr:hypothetical protein [Cryobacterium sp.]
MLLGFIDKHHGICDVMEFIGPVEYTHFPSLETAISHFITAHPSPSALCRPEAEPEPERFQRVNRRETMITLTDIMFWVG